MSRYYDFPAYVPVAERRQNAKKEMEKLKKKGIKVQNVQPEGRKITTTFWGNAWCQHIESLGDYENRLPRGRTYIRNGSVCHLAISQGKVEAIVSGSSLYNITISINVLSISRWQKIKKACHGKISSLISLLSGQLSDEIMDMVCGNRKGLFPSAKDIEFNCNCPDWAYMCKHIAAVLYGIGTRLDSSPEQLFKLRGVNYEELINVADVAESLTTTRSSKRKLIAESAVTDLFDIDLVNSSNKKTPAKLKLAESSASKPIKIVKPNKNYLFPKILTGLSIRKKRRQLGWTQKNLAVSLGVSTSTISKWEAHGRRKLDLKPHVIEELKIIWES